MSIVHQSPVVSHTPLPLIAAPRIAGLLSATVSSTQTKSTHNQQTPPEPDSPVKSFLYKNPLLAELDPEKRDHLLQTVEMLLDIAVDCALGSVDVAALRAAQVLLHRAVTGHSPERPLNPISFRSERDANILEWIVETKRERAAQQAEQERELEEWYNAHKMGGQL